MLVKLGKERIGHLLRIATHNVASCARARRPLVLEATPYAHPYSARITRHGPDMRCKAVIQCGSAESPKDDLPHSGVRIQ
jgi:hypothetical protein